MHPCASRDIQIHMELVLIHMELFQISMELALINMELVLIHMYQRLESLNGLDLKQTQNQKMSC